MNKILKVLLLFLLSVTTAVVIVFWGFLKVIPEHNSSEAQIIGDIIWYDAPDGGMGFKILNKSHPEYQIKITTNSPDEVYYEGLFIYKGSKLDEVTLHDLGSYFGEDITLINGETMVADK